MVIIGIDPGKTGGIVTITEGAVTDLQVMPEHISELVNLLVYWGDSQVHVFLEKAQAMPKNGAVSMFNYGVGFGQIQGALFAKQVRHTLVAPITWTKVMHQGAVGKTAKEKSLEVARRLFPKERLIDPNSTRSKKPHDGIIDALLIAEYGRRLLKS